MGTAPQPASPSQCLFACPHCGSATPLPRCQRCGQAFEQVDGVFQLTRDPGTNLDPDAGPTYIGYDRIGVSYHGGDWVASPLAPDSLAVGQAVAALVGGGTVLDVGCGGGAHALAAAAHGCTVIAGDISGVMLALLRTKAAANRLDPARIIPCRLNALCLPLPDASVDGALLNSLLHLVSEPGQVIAEVHRVLRPGGRLMVQSDVPVLPDPRPEVCERNERFAQTERALHGRYWALLAEAGIWPAPRNWRFHRSAQYAALEAAFGPGFRLDIDFHDHRVVALADYFLPRLAAMGFSDQQGVPEDAHQRAFAQVVAEFRERYGPAFGALAHETVRDGLALQVFVK